MVQVLTILLFGSIFLHDELGDVSSGIGPDPITNPMRVAGITLAGFYAIWGLFHMLAMVCGALVDRTGRVRWVRTAEKGMSLARMAAAAWWVFALFELGWLRAVRTMVGDLLLGDELLAMSPFIGLLVGCWWSIYPVERRFHEALIMRQLDDPHGHTIHPMLTRGQHVWMAVRHQLLLWMLPLTLLMGWQELLVLKAEPIQRVLGRLGPGEVLEPVFMWVGMLAIIIISPALMCMVWDTVRIGPGALADQAHEMCRRYRVRVAGPLLWRTRGSLINGAILGVVWPLRFMLLTDGLLERLAPAQVEAVIAHEVAHVRRRHLIWLAVCVISTGLVGTLSIAVAAGALQWLTHARLNEDWLSVGSGVIGLGGAALTFGLVSRRFEWQADAFAVQHLSRREAEATAQSMDESEAEQAGANSAGAQGRALGQIASVGAVVTPRAVAVMASALQAVADLNGISTGKFSFRHGSIRQRQERLVRLVNIPIAAVPIDRQVRLIKVVAAIALAIGVASMILSEWLHHLGVAQ
jgi:Zn-dependent protease with chaperone function